MLAHGGRAFEVGGLRLWALPAARIREVLARHPKDRALLQERSTRRYAELFRARTFRGPQQGPKLG